MPRDSERAGEHSPGDEESHPAHDEGRNRRQCDLDRDVGCAPDDTHDKPGYPGEALAAHAEARTSGTRGFQERAFEVAMVGRETAVRIIVRDVAANLVDLCIEVVRRGQDERLDRHGNDR